MRRFIQRWARRKRLLLTPHALSAVEDAMELAMARGWYRRPSEVLRDNAALRLISQDPVPNSEEPTYTAALCWQCQRIDEASRLTPGPDGYRICSDCAGRIAEWLCAPYVAEAA